MRLVPWVLVVVAAFVAMSLWNFWLTVRPPRIVIPDTPSHYRLPAEDVAIMADDGIRLAAWLIPRAGQAAAAPAPNEMAVVLLHGYPAEKADMLSIATALHGEFTTLLVDLRYFGASQGRATTLGHRERHDLARAVDVLVARGFTRIGVVGYSLGGAIAILGAAEDSRIRAIAAWAPFADLRVLGRDLYGFLWVLKYPLVELMVLWTRLVLGADITRPTPEHAAARLSIPVLLMHSRDDDQIPFRHAERLAKALATNPRAEFQIGSGHHNEGAREFEQRLAAFLRKSL